MPVRNRCGICVEVESVTRPVAASKPATAPRVSNGTAEIERRRETYCADRPPAEIREHTAIVVDDGIATGRNDARGLAGHAEPGSPASGRGCAGGTRRTRWRN